MAKATTRWAGLSHYWQHFLMAVALGVGIEARSGPVYLNSIRRKDVCFAAPKPADPERTARYKPQPSSA